MCGESAGLRVACWCPWMLTCPAGTFGNGACVQISGGSPGEVNQRLHPVKPLDAQRPLAGHVVVADDQDLRAPGRCPQPVPGVASNSAGHCNIADADQRFLRVDADLPVGPEHRIHLVDVEERAILVLDDVRVPQV